MINKHVCYHINLMASTEYEIYQKAVYTCTCAKEGVCSKYLSVLPFTCGNSPNVISHFVGNDWVSAHAMCLSRLKSTIMNHWIIDTISRFCLRLVHQRGREGGWKSYAARLISMCIMVTHTSTRADVWQLPDWHRPDRWRGFHGT